MLAIQPIPKNVRLGSECLQYIAEGQTSTRYSCMYMYGARPSALIRYAKRRWGEGKSATLLCHLYSDGYTYSNCILVLLKQPLLLACILMVIQNTCRIHSRDRTEHSIPIMH